MTGTILSLTQKPVTQNTFSFGGDDTSLGKTGLFETIVEWDRTSQPDSFKAYFVFFVKKSFEFLDVIGVGTCIYGATGLAGKLKECEYYLDGPQRNRQAREKIIAALGGEAVCAVIPVVQIQQSDFTDYLKLGDAYFRSGQSMVQGEDLAGRKFVLLRMADRTGRIVIATIHQRYRETCIAKGAGGDLWVSNPTNNIGLTQLDLIQVGVDRVAQFIQTVRAGTHNQRLTLAPKV